MVIAVQVIGDALGESAAVPKSPGLPKAIPWTVTAGEQAPSDLLLQALPCMRTLPGGVS